MFIELWSMEWVHVLYSRETKIIQPAMMPPVAYFTEEYNPGLAINRQGNSFAIQLNLIFSVKSVVGSSVLWTVYLRTCRAVTSPNHPLSLIVNIKCTPVIVGKQRYI